MADFIYCLFQISLKIVLNIGIGVLALWISYLYIYLLRQYNDKLKLNNFATNNIILVRSFNFDTVQS